jgi:hypothetical protein
MDNFDPAKAQVLGIEALNRSSSIFFNCLLEGHPQVIHAFLNHYPDTQSIKTPAQAVRYAYDLLVKSLFWEEFSSFDFPFAFQKFRKPFLQYIKKFGISDKTVFLGIHYAVAVLQGKDLAKIKWIIYHAHGEIKHVVRCRKDFEKYKMILTLRDPRASSWSYKKGQNIPVYATVFEAPYYLWLYKRISSEFLIVRHEDLHTKYHVVRKKFCAFLAIKDDSALDEATCFGVPWNGRGKKGALSTNQSTDTKPHKKFVKDDWKQGLSTGELKLANKASKKLGYKKYSAKQKGIPLDYPRLLERDLLFLPGRSSVVRFYKKIERVFGVFAKASVALLTIALTMYCYAQRYYFFVRYR